MKVARLMVMVAAVGGLVTGCRADVTGATVQGTFDHAFTRLYALQQRELGRPDVEAGHFFARATCQKGATGSPQTGAGDDWICIEAFQAAPGSYVQATYELSVRTDGCFVATGPAGIIGNPVLDNPSGQPFVNPLSEFDVCFST